LSAGEGAFAGLRAAPTRSGPALDPSRLIAPPAAHAVDTGPQAGFGIGGQAISTGSASLGTDVGASASVKNTVRFDGG
jgi:hypothetical protein